MLHRAKCIFSIKLCSNYRYISKTDDCCFEATKLWKVSLWSNILNWGLNTEEPATRKSSQSILSFANNNPMALWQKHAWHAEGTDKAMWLRGRAVKHVTEEKGCSHFIQPHALWSEVWNVSKVVGVFGGLWSGDVACPWKVALAAVRRVICSKAWVEAERPVSRPLQLSKMNTIVTKWWREDRFWAYFIEAIGLANR